MADKQKKFNWRGWTTFVTTISFIVDFVSGVILYIAPPGRVANWTNWNIWGLSKDEWGAIHTIFGYVLLIIIGLHIYNNWKIFWNFIWSRARKVVNLRKEMVWATIICLLLFVGTLWEIPPFSSIMELGEYFKDGWAENKAETPLAHGELLSLEEFAKKTNVPVGPILDALKSKGYAVKNAKQTLADIAKENNTSPEILYDAMKSGGVEPEASKTGQGTGMGRKTLAEICSEKGLSQDDAVARLKQQGITAQPSDRLKEIGSKTGKTPMEILAIMEGK